MTETTVVVEKVDTAEVGARKTKLYKVITEDGQTLETFDKSLADAAFSTRGQEVPAEVELDEKWGNTKLLSIAGAKPRPRKGGGGGGQGSAPRQQTQIDPDKAIRDQRIARQWAYGRATELYAATEEGRKLMPLDVEKQEDIQQVAEWLLEQIDK